MGLKATSVAAAFARLTVVCCFEYELVVVIGIVDLVDHVAINATPMAIPMMSKRFECFMFIILLLYLQYACHKAQVSK